MNRLLLLVSASAIALIGCSVEDRSEIGAHASQALKSASVAASKAYDSAAAEASKLSEKSSVQALEASRAALIRAQQELANIQAPAQLDQLKLDAIRAQIERIDAALALQKLQAEAQAIAAKAQGVAILSWLQVQSKRAELRESSPEFRAVDDKIIEAQRVYNDATKKVRETTGSLPGAGN